MKIPLVSNLIFLFTIVISNTGLAAEKRYRGWLWFEDRFQKTQPKLEDITPIEAKKEIELFAKELEDLKFMMLARPSLENVRAYREKEKLMWQNAMNLHDSWDMANLVYPDQQDLLNNPVNVHAIKAKRAFKIEENEQKIKNLAKEFDLVLFFSSNCKYCELLSPVLKDFSNKYGFSVDAINANSNKAHEYFRTRQAPDLIQKLQITAFPTVIAVSHDSKTAFELLRGYVSFSELEDYSLLAIKYLDSAK